jgi:predicted nucleotidyltransferase
MTVTVDEQESRYLARIRELVARQLAGERVDVWLFGSRARGTARRSRRARSRGSWRS